MHCVQGTTLDVSLLSVLGTHDAPPDEASPVLLRNAKRLNRQLNKLDARLVEALAPPPSAAQSAGALPRSRFRTSPAQQPLQSAASLQPTKSLAVLLDSAGSLGNEDAAAAL